MVTTRAQRHSAESSSAGMFPEGSIMDRVDKALSGPIFRLSVPWMVEAAIAVPGSMFGVMVQSLIMLPSWVPLILDPGDVQYFCAVTLPVNLWGAHRVMRWLKDPANKELVFCKNAVPLTGFVHMALAGELSRHPDARAAVSFYVCTWFYGQTTNQLIKNVMWRRRPTACLSEKDGKLAPRHFPQFKVMLMGRPDCLESFPSGDAAGAGGFGFAALLFTGNAIWLLATVLGCFGRVYLHVHHLFDVLVGALLGVAVAFLLDWWIEGGWRKCGWSHLFVCTTWSLCLFGLLLPAMKRRKRDQQRAMGIEWIHH